MIKKIVLIINLLMFFGPGWALWRVWYALITKSGLLKRRFPPVDLNTVQLSSIMTDGIPEDLENYRYFREEKAPKFFFEPGQIPASSVLHQILSSSDRDYILTVADDFSQGRFLYYSRHVFDIGWPVNWLVNPFSGSKHHIGLHWVDYPTFSTEQGDIKDVWEPSRFACAFWLVRAYALTGDERFPRSFWEMFESWCDQNPPNMGPNWKCGQEVALRSLAWCFALYGFWNSSESSAGRVAHMVKMLAIHALRIEKNIGYAISQKNNHAISEAVGLFTIGLLFPELKYAARWLKTGRTLLEQEACRQIYDDGSYIQQSTNYHRMMLQDYIWAIRLADLNGQPFSEELTSLVSRAGEFLFQMLDEKSGSAPNYGPNDGTLVLPLSPCDYRDYRSTIQAAYYQTRAKRILSSGPWDEMLVWLFGEKVLDSEKISAGPTSRRFDTGGYYTIRGRNSWSMVRCHSYRDRPHHVDMLHLDLWYKGINIMGDSGTYKYYIPDQPVFERYFKDIRAHNTVEVDNCGPLQLFSRFLWLSWPKAKCLAHRNDFWQGEHYAYNKKPCHVVHRRSVQLVEDSIWIVTDEILGSGSHDIKLFWHLADRKVICDHAQNSLAIDLGRCTAVVDFEGPAGLKLQVYRGVQAGGSISGWLSAYYGERMVRPTVEVSGSLILPAKIITRISFSNAFSNAKP